MSDLNMLFAAGLASRPMSALAGTPPAYRGPERRSAASQGSRWLALMLDEIDYGMVLLGEGNHVLHVNHAARAELDADHPLQLLGRELRARLSQDVAPLHDALQAAQRGLRRLLTLGERSAAVHAGRGAAGCAGQRRAAGHAAAAGQAPRVRKPVGAVVRAHPRADAGRDARARSAVPGPGSARGGRPATAWAWPRCARRSARSAPRPAPRASATWCAAWPSCRRWSARCASWRPDAAGLSANRGVLRHALLHGRPASPGGGRGIADSA
jgi:hypothetical protein